MTEQTQTPVTFQQDAAPAPAQEQAVTSGNDGQGKTPEYITREEAQRLAEAAAEAAFRKAQGLNDKNAARINARMDEMLKSYTAITGKAPSQDEQARARAEAERQVTSQPIPTPALNEEQVNAKAAELYRTAGVSVDEDDPEAKTVDMSSPEKFLITLQAALDAKRARVQAPTRNPVTAAPILGTGGGASNPIRNINDPTELLKIGFGSKR
jgi:hypothetical protein